jgi:hypothetical protein
MSADGGLSEHAVVGLARFERWRELLTEPTPPGTEPYATAIWHFRSAHGSIRCGRARTCRSDPHTSCWPIGR